MLFGKPGALVTLPFPTGSVGATPDLGEAVHELLDGGAAVDYAAGDVRTRWSFTWEGLNADDAGVLRSFATRQRGRGPWVMYLPETRHNVLSPNVASCGDTLGTADGWSATQATGVPDTLDVHTVSRIPGGAALGWDATGSGNALIANSPYPDMFGWPTDVGRVWSVGAYIRIGSSSVDTAFDVRIGIVWYDAAGVFVSSVGSAYTPITGVYTLRTFTGAAPAGAVYARPFLDVNPSTISALCRVLIDDAHFEIAPSLVSVLPGDGLSRVSIVSPSRELPVAEWSTIKLQLQEV